MRKHLVTPALIVAALVIAVGSYLLGAGRGGEEPFAGTDATATSTIEQSHPGYRPWFAPVLTPAGGEVESGLFALQAALGAGVLGFVLGSLRERRRRGPERPSGAFEGRVERPEAG